MDPITIGILAGSGLLTGLMSQKAKEKEQKRNQEFQAVMSGFESSKEAAGNLGQSQQNALARMMQAYQGIVR